VETVAFDTLVVQRARNCEAPDDFSISAMERRIKGSGLFEIGPQMPDSADQTDALQLMQRCKHC
jgi:hypothetical protein